MKVALTIAGSDSGGGAGIQADLKTFEAHGIFGTSAITSVTAQNTVGVRLVHDIPIEMLRAQIEAVFEDFPVAAVKIGMLSTSIAIECVATQLERYAIGLPIVLDPVMVATSGDRLLDQRAVGILYRRLVPLATLITPNRAEALVLSGADESAFPHTTALAKCLYRQFGPSVLVTGGDPGSKPGEWSDDILYEGDRIHRFRAPRVSGRGFHGTGCTLASAIAANLANGYPLIVAIRLAKDYVHGAIVGSPGAGEGSAVLRHRL